MHYIDCTKGAMGNENVNGSACIGKMLSITSHGNTYLRVTQESLCLKYHSMRPLHISIKQLIPMLISDSLK